MAVARLVLVALLVVSTSLSAQQPKRPLDYGDIFRLASLQGAELSPDGAWVVYQVQQVKLPEWRCRTDLFLVSADGRTTRQLTYTEDEDETARDGGSDCGEEKA